jgi:hypothetical protein
MTPAVDIVTAMRDRRLLGATLGDPSTWSTWFSVLRAAFALPMDDADRATFALVAGDRQPPKHRVREFWASAGRRSAKTEMAAGISVYLAAFASPKVIAGETPTVLLLAASQDQAREAFNRCRGFLTESPALRREIESMNRSEIRLRNGTTLAVHANSFRSVRGRTLLAAVLDEVAYWRDETSATPDVEVYRAVLPALATTHGMLIGVSSPYRRNGLLFEKHRDYFGQDHDDILVVEGATSIFNPTIDRAEIEAQRAADPAGAKSEWDAEFRSDLSSYLDDPLIEAAVDHGRPTELPPQRGFYYEAFCDASGGVGRDAYTIAIGHKEGEHYIVDLVRGTKPAMPFDPHEVTRAYGMLCQEYKVGTVTGDFYGAQWTAGAWSRTGVTYVKSDLPKSQIYLEVLPCFTRGLVHLPDHQRLLRELRLLERTTHKSGRDTVDHGRNGRDDHANSVCGLLRILSAYSGGYDLRIWQLANGDIPDEPRPLSEYADYAARPQTGPDQPFAVRVGDGGYWVPSIEQQWRMLFELRTKEAAKKGGPR